MRIPLACCLLACVADVDLFFFQAEDGIRDVERSRGLGDVYKRQIAYRDQNNANFGVINRL